MLKSEYMFFFNHYEGYCYECQFYFADSTSPGEGFCEKGRGTVDARYSCSDFSR